ncbi:hypothetical protein ABW19_dt0200749 [Dactylella cylindrospora]|nr:hypothetical protein ABW19_dt0200749 [Dactylella cylindrospora]
MCRNAHHYYCGHYEFGWETTVPCTSEKPKPCDICVSEYYYAEFCISCQTAQQPRPHREQPPFRPETEAELRRQAKKRAKEKAEKEAREEAEAKEKAEQEEVRKIAERMFNKKAEKDIEEFALIDDEIQRIRESELRRWERHLRKEEDPNSHESDSEDEEVLYKAKLPLKERVLRVFDSKRKYPWKSIPKEVCSS